MQPYLFFHGRCEEALSFYQEAFRAEVSMLMRAKESPDPIPEPMRTPGWEERIMHASLRIGAIELMMSDGCASNGSFDGFRLSVTVPGNETDRIFGALSQDGSIEMPLTKTFWSPRFGMCTDKFGVGWMVTSTPE